MLFVTSTHHNHYELLIFLDSLREEWWNVKIVVSSFDSTRPGRILIREEFLKRNYMKL